MAHAPLRGVNLGGWLVLEKWITPSLFHGSTAVDEYTFCQNADDDTLLRLEHFRDSFVIKQDFEWLAKNGIDAVRLPIGHWIFGDSAPYSPTVKYVDLAFRWGEENGIKILLDIHSVVGSQNGKIHSGRSGKVEWTNNPSNISATLELVQKLADRYGNNSALLGISLLNEPDKSIPKQLLVNYYHDAYKIIRKSCGNEVWVVYSDYYLGAKWRKRLKGKNFKNLYVDTHYYQIYGALDKKLPSWLNLLRTRWFLPLHLAHLRQSHPLIVGEWSLARSSSNLHTHNDAERHQISQQYASLQLAAYSKTSAWFYWTYKTEDKGDWNFRASVEKGSLR